MQINENNNHFFQPPIIENLSKQNYDNLTTEEGKKAIGEILSMDSSEELSEKFIKIFEASPFLTEMFYEQVAKLINEDAVNDRELDDEIQDFQNSVTLDLPIDNLKAYKTQDSIKAFDAETLENPRLQFDRETGQFLDPVSMTTLKIDESLNSAFRKNFIAFCMNHHVNEFFQVVISLKEFLKNFKDLNQVFQDKVKSKEIRIHPDETNKYTLFIEDLCSIKIEFSIEVVQNNLFLMTLLSKERIEIAKDLDEIYRIYESFIMEFSE